MKSKAINEQVCAVETCADVIGGRWKGQIVTNLMKGTRRFGELRRLIPKATPRMLTLQLRELEKDGLVARKVYPATPPKVEYSLTKRGRDLKPVFDLMWQWGTAFLASLPSQKVELAETGIRRNGAHLSASGPA